MVICSSSICSFNYLLYSSKITTFALYVICSIRQLIYDITRHLLYKHFYGCDGLIALLNICSMSKHVICSINIFLQFYILQFFLQFHFSANFLEILFYYYEGFNHGRTILPSIFKTSPCTDRHPVCLE